MGRFLRRWRGSRWARLAARVRGRRLVVVATVPVAAVLVLGLVAVLVTAIGRAQSAGSAADGQAPDPAVTQTPAVSSSGSGTSGSGTSGSGTPAPQAVTMSQIIIPDLLVVAPDGLTAGQVSALRAVPGVRNMISFAGAQITVGGEPVNVIGVSPAQFRPWVPLQTASDQSFWDDLSRGEFVAETTSAKSLDLRPGGRYELDGGATKVATYGMSAELGLSGIDLLVNQSTSARLGLVRQVAALISAPADSITTLRSKVAAILGPSGKIEVLRAQPAASASAPAPAAGSAEPDSYLQLFQESAARYCPGLSWTVLAAIGQIESADGQNDGPSTAGALGPMQFLPSTWQQWGITGFGQTGTPDVMNPYDAVPSAARMLCADGAATGQAGLRQAIYDYNHANWYVTEVLALASEYASDYS